jgi:hypothetical protein
MADEKKIDVKDRDKRYIYAEDDVKYIFGYGPSEKSAEKIEKK